LEGVDVVEGVLVAIINLVCFLTARNRCLIV